jgi:hypothetical protein
MYKREWTEYVPGVFERPPLRYSLGGNIFMMRQIGWLKVVPKIVQGRGMLGYESSPRSYSTSNAECLPSWVGASSLDLWTGVSLGRLIIGQKEVSYQVSLDIINQDD